VSQVDKTAFVLGGGGRWGAVEVGMLQALGDAGIQPDLVLGTSIGAFNGAIIAEEKNASGAARLADLWTEIAEADLFKGGIFGRMRNVATMKPAIQGNGELREILEEIHGADRRIEDLEIPFQCVAASIERTTEHWFESGPLVEAILASAAIPVLFPPVEIGGEHFYDGGLVNSIPVDRAVKLGASRVFVLQVGRVESDLRPPERLHEAALISFEIARRHRFTSQWVNMPHDVEVHLLPSGNTVEFDDRRQLKWRDTGMTPHLIEGAREASIAYLSEADLM
jgi:NTE family protein